VSLAVIVDKRFVEFRSATAGIGGGTGVDDRFPGEMIVFPGLAVETLGVLETGRVDVHAPESRPLPQNVSLRIKRSLGISADHVARSDCLETLVAADGAIVRIYDGVDTARLGNAGLRFSGRSPRAAQLKEWKCHKHINTRTHLGSRSVRVVLRTRLREMGWLKPA
jgi:hypothetical protein